MADEDQNVSILALLKDELSGPAKKIADATQGLIDVINKLGESSNQTGDQVQNLGKALASSGSGTYEAQLAKIIAKQQILNLTLAEEQERLRALTSSYDVLGAEAKASLDAEIGKLTSLVDLRQKQLLTTQQELETAQFRDKLANASSDADRDALTQAYTQSLAALNIKKDLIDIEAKRVAAERAATQELSDLEAKRINDEIKNQQKLEAEEEKAEAKRVAAAEKVKATEDKAFARATTGIATPQETGEENTDLALEKKRQALALENTLVKSSIDTQKSLLTDLTAQKQNATTIELAGIDAQIKKVQELISVRSKELLTIQQQEAEVKRAADISQATLDTQVEAANKEYATEFSRIQVAKEAIDLEDIRLKAVQKATDQEARAVEAQKKREIAARQQAEREAAKEAQEAADAASKILTSSQRMAVGFAEASELASAGVSKLLTALNKVQQATSQLTGGRLGTALLIFGAARLVNDSAKYVNDEYDAQEKLRASLSGNLELYDKVLAQADEYGQKTRFTSNQIRNVAAELAELGVPQAKLQEAVLATANLAASSKENIDTLAKDIAKTFTDGTVSETLSQYVRGLQQYSAKFEQTSSDVQKLLNKQQLRGGLATDVINAEFANRAVNQALDPIGRIETLKARITESVSGIGAAFLATEEKVLTVVDTMTNKWLAFTKTVEGRELLDAIGTAVADFAKIVPVLLEIFIAAKGFGVLVNIIKVLTALTVAYTAANKILEAAILAVTTAVNGLTIAETAAEIASGFIPALAAILGVAAAVLLVSGNLQKVQEEAPKAADDLRDVFNALKTGKISFGDLGTIVLGEVEKIYNTIKFYLYDEPIIILGRFFTFLVDVWQFDLASIEQALTLFATASEAIFFLFFNEILKGIDNVTKGFTDMVKLVSGVVITPPKLAPGFAAAAAPVLNDQLKAQKAADDKVDNTKIGGAIKKTLDKNPKIGFGDYISKVVAGSGLDDFVQEINDAKKKLDAANAAIDNQTGSDLNKPTSQDNTDKNQKAADAAAQKARLKQTEDIEDEINQVRLHKTLDLQKQLSDLQAADLKKQYDARLISLEDYLAQSQALEQKGLKDELAAVVTQIDSLIDARNATKKGSQDYLLIDQQILELEKKKAVLQINFNALLDKQATEADKLRKQVAAEKSALEASLNKRANDSATDEDQILLNKLKDKQIADENEIVQLRKKGTDQADIDLAIATQKLETDKLTLEVQQAQRKLELDRNLDRSNTKVIRSELNPQPGVANPANTKALEDLRNNYDQQVEALKEKQAKDLKNTAIYTDEMEALAEKLAKDQAAIQGTFFDGLQKGFDDTKASIESDAQFGAEIGDRIKTDLAGGFTDAFVSIIQGTKSVGQAFSEMAVSILADLGKIFIEKAIVAAISMVFNKGGVVPGLNKGGIRGLETGGYVAGDRNSPNRDSVLSYLTPGEGVIQRPAVDYYGTDFINGVNQMLFPKSVSRGFQRINSPSPVSSRDHVGELAARMGSSGSSSGRLSSAQPVIVASEQNADAIFKGGTNALIRHVAKNYKAIKAQAGDVS